MKSGTTMLFLQLNVALHQHAAHSERLDRISPTAPCTAVSARDRIIRFYVAIKQRLLISFLYDCQSAGIYRDRSCVPTF